jgi:hypothetical protein
VTMTSPFQSYLQARAPSPLAEAAIALGMPVFPCNSNKQPVSAHGFKDASDDPETIKRMFANASAALIGVPTGADTGFFVLDVDVKANRQGGDWLNANSHRMVQSRTIHTGSGGLHIYFRHPGGRIKNSNDKIAPGIDIRGDGGYVIVPPSPGYSIADDAPMADAPDWLLNTLTEQPEPVRPNPQPSPHHSSGNTPYGMAALEAECNAIRSAYFGSQETTLNAACLKIGSLAAAGELESGYALSALLAAARSMANEPGKPRWGYAEVDRKVRRAFSDGERQPRDVPDRAPVEEVHPAAAFLAKLYANEARRTQKPIPVSDDLMEVDGALKLMVDYCVSTAISPQPFLALGAALCALGALAGRKYKTRTNLRTNIYAVGIAESGGGKDHARVCIKESFFAAGLADYLGGEDIASGSALLSSLNRFPSRLFQIDEMGKFLGALFNSRAPTHKAEIWTNLTKLYTSAGGVFIGTEYADQKTRPRTDIHQPCASLYGATVPHLFWNAVDSGAMNDGSLARFLIFLTPEDYPDRSRTVTALEPPAALVEALQAIAAGVPDHDYGGNIAATMVSTATISPYVVPLTPEAEHELDALGQKQLSSLRRAKKEQQSTAVYARLVENATKVALIRAVGRNPTAPVIQASDVAWAKQLVMHCINTIVREAGGHVAENAVEAAHKKVLHVIRQAGRLSKSDLIRKTQFLRSRERDEIVAALVEAGLLLIEHEATQTKPRTFYVSNPASGSTSINTSYEETDVSP